jgi:hypothetical protein
MLIYLHPEIVRCFDYHRDVICGDERKDAVHDERLRQVKALRLIELDYMTEGFRCVAPPFLFAVLRRGQPTTAEEEAYQMLEDDAEPDDVVASQVFEQVRRELAPLGIRDEENLTHLVHAVALDVSWFLTDEPDLLSKTGGRIRNTRIGQVSDCVEAVHRALCGEIDDGGRFI